ncbi:MAG: toll/interleukin-1 receptor domain-containing protein, partial [Candidatus Promineofilum sp.]|nr:toll/interleukin-1 receptor domain-containing protein [Promineifilum sp.]
MDIPNDQLRQFFINAFSDDELEDFCFDYFPAASQEFAPGMPVGRKARLLISFADRRGQREHLLVALGKVRPEQFAAAFKKLPQPAAPPSVSTTRLTRRVFISHAEEDAALAHRLATALREAGRPVWIAPDDILPGEQWVEAIGRGLTVSGLFVVLMTPQAVQSEWVKYEVNLAITLERRLRMEIVPLEVTPAETPITWSAYQAIAFSDYDAHLPHVLERLVARRKLPQGRPASPALPPPQPPR